MNATPEQVSRINSLLARTLPAQDELAERIAEFQRDVDAVSNYVAAVPGVLAFTVSCNMRVADALFDALEIIGLINAVSNYTVNYSDGRTADMTTAYVFDADNNIPKPTVHITRETARTGVK